MVTGVFLLCVGVRRVKSGNVIVVMSASRWLILCSAENHNVCVRVCV